MTYQAIDLNTLCKEKVSEISAVKLNTCSTKSTLCCVYRSPSENPNYFLELLEKTLNLLYQPNISLVICGELNINFLVDSSVKQNLKSLRVKMAEIGYSLLECKLEIMPKTKCATADSNLKYKVKIVNLRSFCVKVGC